MRRFHLSLGDEDVAATTKAGNGKLVRSRLLFVSLPCVFKPVATKDPTAVEVEVQKAYIAMFPKGNLLFVPRVFGWAIECFTGSHADYQAVDARYHDFEHTLQGTLCLARLLHARFHTRAKPVIPERIFQLGIIAILLHDSGYLKKRDDKEGTGAKYTATHVHRSTIFSARLLAEKRFSEADITTVENMIRCTGVDTMLQSILFQSEEEKLVGHALATADLLGQMAADDYVDKLPVLYAEFLEAAKHDHGYADFIKRFGGVNDLIADTPFFWRNTVLPKLERDFGNIHHFLNDPYPDGPNWYLQHIEKNLARIRQKKSAAAV